MNIKKIIWVGNQKQELVDAINKVLFTQYKKDAKEAHELVASYDLEIDKYDGFYGVYNPETYKRLRLVETHGWRGSWLKERHTNKPLTNEEINAHKLNIDVINYLCTPINTAWHEAQELNCDWGYKGYHPSQNRYGTLSDARWNVKYHKKNVEDTKKEIDKLLNDVKNLQARLLRETESVYKYEAKLREVRKELGLKGEVA